MDWREVTIQTTTFGAELVSDLLLELGAAGTAVQDKAEIQQFMAQPRDWDMIDEHILDDMQDDVLVQAWFPEDERIGDTLHLLRQRLEELQTLVVDFDLGKLSVATEGVHDEDWENNWKKYYKPFAVGQKLCVCPEWEQPGDEAQGRIVVRLEPGMAFGTGTHETTFMCLELGEQYINGGETVYDIGCGTGILAAAALLLGAKEALAVDRDPVAVKAAQCNAALNDVQHLVDARLGDLLQGVQGSCEVMFANIIAEVILRMLPDAYTHIKPGGILITSGIIREKAQSVQQGLLQNGFTVLQMRSRGEWVAIAAQKN